MLTITAAIVLKIATLAPEGSSWMKLFHEWATTIETRTEGRVKVKFYAGGVQGDERDVVKKIRLGQLQGAALTGIGISAICPEARTFDIARSEAELDALRVAIGDDVKKKLEEKGFVLGSWGDVGPIHLFTNKQVASIEDLRGLKLWLWSDDPVSGKLFAALGLRGVPMGVPEVLPGLTTGQVDSFFGSPLSTLALQWSSHVKFMSSRNVGYATGATILSKKAWDAIPAADQAILKEETAAVEKKVLTQVRLDNARALEAMKKQGLTVVDVPPALRGELEKRGEEVARAASKELPADFQQRVEKVVQSYRK
jgi:TRAP-type C4-dicarboxylate transport system substrate-binding protein